MTDLEIIELALRRLSNALPDDDHVGIILERLAELIMHAAREREENAKPFR